MQTSRRLLSGPLKIKTQMKFSVINKFHSDQRGPNCFNRKQRTASSTYESCHIEQTEGRCRKVSSFQSNGHEGSTSPQPELCTNYTVCFFFPTSWHYSRHICWTWYCLDRFRLERWRETGRHYTMIPLPLLETPCRVGLFKMEPNRLCTFREISALSFKDRKCVIIPPERYSCSDRTMLVLVQTLTQKQEREINEQQTVEKQSEKATLLVL